MGQRYLTLQPDTNAYNKINLLDILNYILLIDSSESFNFHSRKTLFNYMYVYEQNTIRAISQTDLLVKWNT